MEQARCEISGQTFAVSDFEMQLRARLGAPLPHLSPREHFRHLLAFWQHFTLHHRTCDRSGRSLISVFDQDCEYQVWARDVWLEEADPPSAEYDFDREFFEQLWEVFRQSPIPHNVNVGNENCDYADDWWFSKNCYLGHSGLECEDCQYCYRTYRCQDCQLAVFSTKCELCSHTVNCENCFSLVYGVHCRQCRDSAFLFDCWNCEDCFLCWNLRNKRYCYKNQQLTKEQYQALAAECDTASRAAFDRLQQEFESLVRENALYRATDVIQCENCSGAYIRECRNGEGVYFLQEAEDCAQTIRGIDLKDTVGVIGSGFGELLLSSVLIIDDCYDVKYSFVAWRSRHLEYCAYCYNCEHCFACCGLVGKKYCILNKQYSEDDYLQLTDRIRAAIRKEGVEGRFFPGHFAPSPYDESLAAFHFPLSAEQQQALGFRVAEENQRSNEQNLPHSPAFDRASEADESLLKQAFWDQQASRPYQIKEFDIKFSKKLAVPLPNSYYMRRIKQLFSYMPFDGGLRPTRCALTGVEVYTNLPSELDGRIAEEAAYLSEFS